MDKIKVGDSAEFRKQVTEKDIQTFADVSGDRNPLHLSSEFAADSMFKERIAHGFLVGSFISTVIGLYLPGPGSVYLSQNLEFKAPVRIGDTVTARVEILDFPKSRFVRLKTTCHNQDGTLVIDGTALVLPPKDVALVTK